MITMLNMFPDFCYICINIIIMDYIKQIKKRIIPFPLWIVREDCVTAVSSTPSNPDWSYKTKKNHKYLAKEVIVA